MTEHGVSFPVPGRITSLLVDEGEEVTQGQLLAKLERYELASREYDRLVKLLAQGGTNRQAVEEAELAMLDQRMLSPVNGVVLTKVHEIGEVSDPTSPVLIVGDKSKLWIRIYVPEGLVNRVHMNQSAKIKFDGLDQDFPGHVSFISPKAQFTPRNVQTPEERVTQTFAVKVELNQPKPFMRAGVPADVWLHLPQD